MPAFNIVLARSSKNRMRYKMQIVKFTQIPITVKFPTCPTHMRLKYLIVLLILSVIL